MQKIGVWGFGVAGKSIINFLIKYRNISISDVGSTSGPIQSTPSHSHPEQVLNEVEGRSRRIAIQLMDKRELTEQEKDFLNQNNIDFLNQNNNIKLFFDNNDIIIPSAGVDLRDYKDYSHKIITELDIFSNSWKKDLIAITGTVGKTSITCILNQILIFFNKKVFLAGNIGYGMLENIEKQDEYDLALLELSSFQLERSKLCTPSISVWTNFYPNHLDRHGSLSEYFKAKFQILANQKSSSKALIPLELLKYLKEYELCEKLIQNIAYFSEDFKNIQEYPYIKQPIYYIDEEKNIFKFYNNKKIKLININSFPEISYKHNWVIIIALLDLLNLDFKELEKLNLSINLSIPNHRLEKIKTINNIVFYNDSKSTIAEATLEAVNHLRNAPTHLILGGISKGVDRAPLIKKLKNKVKAIYCFGKEASNLAEICKAENITCYKFETLAQVVEQCIKEAKPGDQILLSPAGASYDQFKDYQERGEVFKELINKIEAPAPNRIDN